MDQELLGPIPQDLSSLAAKASFSNHLAAETVNEAIERLERAREQILNGEHPDQLLPLSSYLKTANNKVAASHKEWSSAVSKLAKSVDKKFSTPLVPLFPPPGLKVASPPNVHPSLLAITSTGPSSSPLPPQPTTFGSPSALAALNETIALHLARIGAFSSLSAFLTEATTPVPAPDQLAALHLLHSILSELAHGICTQALNWVFAHRDADPDRDLEFELRKEEFIRLLLLDTDLSGSSDPLLPPAFSASSPHIQSALAYVGNHLKPLWSDARGPTISALSNVPLFMPFSRLLTSPYAALFADYTDKGDGAGVRTPDTRLKAAFMAAFLRTIKLPKDSPLTVVTDVGGGGAMARIQKVRTVMKEKKTEWSAVDELPVEIPLPTSHRFHSIFACPVSKEQSTAQNPPMLLPCGHVIARESLTRLARGTPTLKCPYCPAISHCNQAVQVHF